MCYRKSTVVFQTTTLVLALTFAIVECKTVTSSSRVLQSSAKIPTDKSDNVFLSVAKSLANQAFSEIQDTARRNPRLGLNITMPLFLRQGDTSGTGSDSQFASFAGNLTSLGTLLGTNAQLGLIGIKGGLLGIKAAVIQSFVLLLFVIFLVSGIAYFACNIGVVSCANLGSGLGDIGGGSIGQLGSGGNPFSRSGSGYDYHNLHRSTSAVYNAIEDGQKKYT